MLYRAPIAFVKNGKISKKQSDLVVVMRHYPRFTPREWIDEYVLHLAPDAALFNEFKALEKTLGDHNEAFARVGYQQRFTISDEGKAELKRFSLRAETKTVYFICQCNYEQRCHTDLLLLAAKKLFHAPISELPFSYPAFEARFVDGVLT